MLHPCRGLPIKYFTTESCFSDPVDFTFRLDPTPDFAYEVIHTALALGLVLLSGEADRVIRPSAPTHFGGYQVAHLKGRKRGVFRKSS